MFINLGSHGIGPQTEFKEFVWVHFTIHRVEIVSVIIHQDITSHLCWEVSLVTLSTYFT